MGRAQQNPSLCALDDGFRCALPILQAVRRVLTAVLLSLAFAAGCTTQPRLGDSVDAAIPTTIEAVRADPAQYHHKFVELRGLVDACTPWGCDLLSVRPGTIPAKADFRASILAGISFDFLPVPGSQAENDSVDRSADLMQELYRFAEVTLVGQYNAACALGHDPDDVPQKGKPRNDVICLDHADGLQIYRVLAVHKRWPSSAGALWGHEPTQLVPLSPKQTESLFDSFKAVATIPRSDLNALDGEHRAFVNSSRADMNVLCICRTERCAGKWPATFDDLVPAPANPYQCTVGIRTEIGWRFPPAWFE